MNSIFFIRDIHIFCFYCNTRQQNVALKQKTYIILYFKIPQQQNLSSVQLAAPPFCVTKRWATKCKYQGLLVDSFCKIKYIHLEKEYWKKCINMKCTLNAMTLKAKKWWNVVYFIFLSFCTWFFFILVCCQHKSHYHVQQRDFKPTTTATFSSSSSS